MADDIDVVCPKCGHLLIVASEYAGRRGACPYCDEHFVIPALDVGLKPIVSSFSGAESASVGTTNVRDSIYPMNSPAEYRNFAWRRWTGRGMDLLLGYAIEFVLFYIIVSFSDATGMVRGFCKWLAEPNHRIYDLIISTCFAFFSDSLVYAIFKTTLGKKINGVSICDVSGNRIDRKGYLRRDVEVFLRGEWLCITLLCRIAEILQYNRVSKGEPSSYDKGCTYQARPTRGKAEYDIILIILVFIIGGAICAAD